MFVEASADETTADDDVGAHSHGMSTRRPLNMTKCRDIAEVMAAVNFARDNGFRVAILGGGQDGRGGCNVTDGFVIDVSSVRGGAACRKALNWSGLA